MQLSWAILLLGASAVLAAPADDVMAREVTTEAGRVRGVTKTNGQGVQYSQFLGIPYAKPPTGNRRFSRPEVAEAWTGTRDASQFGASCPQTVRQAMVPSKMDEDCLFLNVYVPQSTATRRHLPVMVFIHGGGYVVGSSTFYGGENLISKGVIVVTVNYRLGPLGFLSTGDAAAPGNYGLLDQIMALQWVKDNIAAFNGNPNKVTIFGESAGAGSVSILLLSPLSKGLFNGVIAESGSSLSPWAVALPYNYPSQPAIAKDLGSKVGCQATDHTALVACLRTKDAQALASADVIKDVVTESIWRPVVETLYGVLPAAPLDMLQAGRAHPVPVMSGTNKDEYSIVLQNAIPNIEKGLPYYFFKILVRDLMFRLYAKAAFTLAPRALEIYTAGVNTSDPKALREAWSEIQTDVDMFVPAMGELLLLKTSRRPSTYFQYLFNHRPATVGIPDWGGTPHALELAFVFGEPFGWDSQTKLFYNATYNDLDRKVSDTMMTLWTNFAKYGNPTPKPVDGETWPVFTEDQRAYLRIEDRLTPANDLRRTRFDFWSQEVLVAMGLLTKPPPHPTHKGHPPGNPVVG